jgi:N-dimethylarginine dimethylaminohydrolase
MTYSANEWSPLKQIILGSATNMNWPSWEEEFPEAPYNRPVEPWIIEESNTALDHYQSVLESLDVQVLRPIEQDYVKLNGFGAYSTRDATLIIGNKVIFTPTMFKQRRLEWPALKPLFDSANFIYAPLDTDIMFDAANIMRCNNDIIYLISGSGNEAGGVWLQNELGSEYTVHFVRDLYAGHHVDSTIIPLREGLVMLNAGRANESHVPEFMKLWDKIWITDDDIVDETSEIDIASKWLGMNILSVNENLVILNEAQIGVMKKLAKHKIDSIGCTLPHGRYLLGGQHCTTLDTIRIA